MIIQEEAQKGLGKSICAIKTALLVDAIWTIRADALKIPKETLKEIWKD